MESLVLRPGAVVVFEGLDKAGKTTQLDQLRERTAPGSTLFAHMPTGFTSFTRGVRALLEDEATRPQFGLAQQLAHLACHAEAVPRLNEQRERGAVVLDRWWWSGLAYGWYSGALQSSGLDRDSFETLIRVIWAGVTADVVFLFAHPFEDDAHNSAAIESGYDELARQFADICVRVPRGDAVAVSAIIDRELEQRGLAVRD